MAALLTDLLKGNKKGGIRFTAAAHTAFTDLKNHFVRAPILKMLDPSLPFEVEVNASEVGVEAVPSQHHATPQNDTPALSSHASYLWQSKTMKSVTENCSPSKSR